MIVEPPPTGRMEATALACRSTAASIGQRHGERLTRLRLSRDLPLWLAFLTLDAGTQIAFKWGGQALAGIDFGAQWFERFAGAPAIWIGIAGYIVAFVLWIAILQGSDLTRAVTLTGVSFATVPLAGWLIFAESISPLRMLGIAIIVAGVTLMTRPRKPVLPP